MLTVLFLVIFVIVFVIAVCCRGFNSERCMFAVYCQVIHIAHSENTDTAKSTLIIILYSPIKLS